MADRLKPEVLDKMRKRADYWGPPSRERCVGEDHMARDVLELLAEIDALRAEVDRLTRRSDMLDRAAHRWSEAARREVPTTSDIETAREQFVECKIRQEEAPHGSIMRRVCDAAMSLVDLLDQRDTSMKAHVVELALECDALRADLARVTAERDLAREVLGEMEWSDMVVAGDHWLNCCEMCDNHEAQGHKPDCRWLRAMGRGEEKP